MLGGVCIVGGDEGAWCGEEGLGTEGRGGVLTEDIALMQVDSAKIKYFR